jgi:hypothetical protein
MDDHAGMVDFVGIGELAETTTNLMALCMQHSSVAPSTRKASVSQVEQWVLQQAREHLRTVREGFMLSVRTSQTSHYRELRYLLDRVMLDWGELSEALGLDKGDGGQTDDPDCSQKLELVRSQVLAFGMAVVALGYLPRLPAKAITFPHSYSKPPTYSDIPVPNSAGEMLWRIEELEQTIWRMMEGAMPALVQHAYGPLRRTYGFFEASALLSLQESERFGMKKQQTKLSWF